MAELGEPIAINVEPEIPTGYPTVDDLVGVAKTFAQEVKKSIENIGTYKRYGLNPNKSFLIDGKPGTGKTFSVQALYNSLNKDAAVLVDRNTKVKDLFNPSVTLFSYNIGEYGTAYVNRGSRIIQEFFEKVYNYSYDSPVILKLDEADALLSSRLLDVHGEDRKNLETLMKNLQIANEVPNLYVVMLTNLKDYVDDAVKRAGRVDKHFTYPIPDYNTRHELFGKIIKNRNSRCDYKVIRGYNLDKLADMTNGFTHADIANVIDSVVRDKVNDVIKKEADCDAEVYGYVTQSKLEKKIQEHRTEFGCDKNQTDTSNYIL